MYRAPQSSLMRWMEAPNCSIAPNNAFAATFSTLPPTTPPTPTCPAAITEHRCCTPVASIKLLFFSFQQREKEEKWRSSQSPAQNWKKESLGIRLRRIVEKEGRKGIKITLNLIPNIRKCTVDSIGEKKNLADLVLLKCPSCCVAEEPQKS